MSGAVGEAARSRFWPGFKDTLSRFVLALLVWVGVVAVSWLLIWIAWGTPVLTHYAWNVRENHPWMILVGLMGVAAMLTAGGTGVDRKTVNPLFAALLMGAGHLLLILFCQRIPIDPRVTLLPDHQTEIPGGLALISEYVGLFIASAVVRRLPPGVRSRRDGTKHECHLPRNLRKASSDR